MELSKQLTGFLLAHYNKFTRRTFIIDLMTQVADRPAFGVYASEMPTQQKLSVTIDLMTPPAGAKYHRPYTEEDMAKHGYSADLIESLKKDPVHGYRMLSGIELSHEEPDVWELIRVRRNWLTMTDEQKERSDDKSRELFGIDNETHFKELFATASGTMVGEIIELYSEESKSSCIVGIDKLEGTELTYVYLGSGERRLCGETDTFRLPPKVMQCCPEGVDTTVGRFLLNYLLVEHPFHGAFPYQNEAGFNLDDLEKKISKGLMNNRIEVTDYKQFVDNLYFIGHFCELCVPTITRAALTTDPKIEQVKKELLKKYAGKLSDPATLAEIEDTLIAMDKAYLKDDESMRFMKPLGDKPFNISRKKLYLTVGGVEAFSKDVGKYDFIPQSLAEGWTNESLPLIANEIRKGSYNRGHETQLGGALTKYVMRVFQDMCVTEDDCGANRGLEVDFKVHDIKNFMGRYIRDNGKWVAITEDNAKKYANGKYVMRSPMYCRTKDGICKRCAGDIYANLNTKHVAMYIVDISSTFTTMALKLMHGSKLSLVDIGDPNQYLIQ